MLTGVGSLCISHYGVDDELQQRYFGWGAGYYDGVVVCACKKALSRAEVGGFV